MQLFTFISIISMCCENLHTLPSNHVFINHDFHVFQLWLTLAEKYLTNKGVDWKKAERTCFNEWSNPDDDELGLQIVRVSS